MLDAALATYSSWHRRSPYQHSRTFLIVIRFHFAFIAVVIIKQMLQNQSVKACLPQVALEPTFTFGRLDANPLLDFGSVIANQEAAAGAR